MNTDKLKLAALKILAERTLKVATTGRCATGYDSETGDYKEGSCEAMPTHRIGVDKRSFIDVCEACSEKFDCRYVDALPGIDGIVIARELANAVLEAQ